MVDGIEEMKKRLACNRGLGALQLERVCSAHISCSCRLIRYCDMTVRVARE
jgi:hypothetical protein